MSEVAEEENPTAVTTIRETVKENIRIARLRHRQDELDNLRITHGDPEDDSINLQTFTKNDVLDIANKIKKQRHASTTDLLKLCHAFLQSIDNINCFVNTTGAVPVIVKEMTGKKTETQMLAIECLCNLSLGSEDTSEKVAQKAGTYLHTFLQSSNESIVRTSLWCLTNLIVAGKKPLKIMISQEIISALINVTLSIHNRNLTDESYVAIELILDHGGVPRPSDIETLCAKWILHQEAPLDLGKTKIVYKLLNLLEFKSNDAIEMDKLVYICFGTLLNLYDVTSSSPPAPSESREFLHQVVLLMRICSNLVALENSYADYIIDNWFRTQSRSLATFFNYFIKQMAATNLSIEEIYWFIGNLMKCQLSDTTLKYVETDEFFAKIQMEV
ncbi:uncharacterized protein LOC129565094 [Sitodiplosis mosellana]|uniref:uncharacterized protein LOC129565094 n=1 Tax=Sitodiplosis mosellana TaxID=263140 RepID=UPI002444AA35|nr:uncharacterized protein LOC129565094 [Sitodiplosis mosellana]